ncbi:MAG: AAA family ATPase [Phycisphaerales bacterium]|nr:AAA family ATPase [Phycisphaerales bacterium]
MIEVARQYQQAGLSVLPANRSEKRPALAGWKDYQSRLPTEAEVMAWFANAHDALCLVTGAVSGNLELLDFDNGGELFSRWAELVEAEMPGLMGRLVIETSQSGGWHVLYRCTEKVCGSIHLAQRIVSVPDDNPIAFAGKPYKPRRNAAGGWEVILTLIETRGEGGLFLCHPTPGYEMQQGEIEDLPVLTAEERDVLLEAAWSLNELIPSPVAVPSDPQPHNHGERPGDAFNARGDVTGLLVQHGWTLVRDGENQYWRRPGKNKGWSATLKDRVFYVFSSNAAPFDGPKAYGPFAVYTMLEHNGDYTKAASTLRTQGYGSTPSPSSSPPSASSPPSSSFDGTTSALLPQPLSVRALMSKYPNLRPPILHGLLREGETMNLISAPKAGKSWLATDLAICVATGRDWLGQFGCERGEVLILDNELHGETSANRIPKVANARGIPIDSYADHVHVENLRGRQQDVFSLATYFQALKPGRFKIIILDAFYRFMPRDMDENDNGTMANLYNHIDRYADLLRCSFVLIHHTTKGNQSGKSVTDVGAGAGSQSRATDTHMVLRPHDEEDAVVLDAAVRSWPPVAPRCLRWSYPIWSPADELNPEELRVDKGKKKAEKKEQWTPQAFVDAFIDDQPVTRSAILTKAIDAGLSRWLADNLLRAADADLLVTRHGEGKRGQPCTYTSAKLAGSTEGELL